MKKLNKKLSREVKNSVEAFCYCSCPCFCSLNNNWTASWGGVNGYRWGRVNF